MRARTIALIAVLFGSGAFFALRRHQPPAPSAPETQRLIEAGEYETAERAARDHFDRTAASQSPDSSAYLLARDELIQALRTNGRLSDAQTLALAEQSVGSWRSHTSGEPARLAAALLHLGELLTDRADYSRSVEALTESLSIAERTYGTDANETAVFLSALGRAHVESRAYALATPLLERSLRLAENNPATTAHTLEALVTAAQRKGNYAEAREFLDRLLAVRASTPPRHPAHIESFNLLALQLWFEGQPTESKGVSRRALALAEQTLRVEHPLTANTLRILAATLWGLGEVTDARTQSTRALEIARRCLGPEHPGVAAFWNDLGNVNLELGAYTEARTQFAEALRLAESKLRAGHEWIPNFLHNLALVDARLGDLDAAREEQTRTTELWERSLGSTHPFVAVGLGELADVVRRQGDNVEAASLLRRALRIRERSMGPRHRDTAYTLSDLAATVAELGQRAEARRLAGRALAILQRTETEDSPALATTLELHARLELADRHPGLALGYFDRALAVRTRALGPSHPLVADVMVGLATAQSAMGRSAEAMRTALTAEKVARDHLHLMLRHLPERESLNYAAARPRGLDLILSLATKNAATASSFEALLKSRALVLDEMAARHRLGSSEPGVADLQAKLVAAQQRLANVLVRGPRDSAVERYLLLVNEARRTKETAERVLAEHSASYRAELSETQAGVREIQQAIAADVALVSYVRFQRIAAGRRSLPSYLAFVTRRDRDPVAIALGTADVLERRITRWRTIVNADSTNPGQYSSSRLREAGRALRQALWDPLEPALAGAANIFVVPDAALNLVPLTGLPGYAGEYLVEEHYNIHYLSSERDLVALHSPSRQAALLALGGAAFDDVVASVLPARGSRAAARSIDAPCESFENLRFTPLAGTLEEVKEISRVWNDAVPGPAATSRLLLAGQADETTFKREASRHRVLHLATHGFFLDGPCVTQSTRTRAVGGLVRTDDLADQSRRRINQPERPLRLSGLALAGANRRGSAAAADDDGILTAEEVAALDLRDVEWAVLSACNTGVGELRAGEGVLGLRRAFEVAGVHTVIMSLWPVEDDVTRQWMVALYEARLKNRRSTSAAMRDASLVVLHRRRAAGQSTSPFYWAAFVAAGAWQ